MLQGSVMEAGYTVLSPQGSRPSLGFKLLKAFQDPEGPKFNASF